MIHGDFFVTHNGVIYQPPPDYLQAMLMSLGIMSEAELSDHLLDTLGFKKVGIATIYRNVELGVEQR
jgi:hypothetical protein